LVQEKGHRGLPGDQSALLISLKLSFSEDALKVGEPFSTVMMHKCQFPEEMRLTVSKLALD
jgi:hypothetical protein